MINSKNLEKVSLYIPCFNAEKSIERCLSSVLQQTYPIDEVIIIDDGSEDRTVEIASDYPARIIAHRKNKGLAAARNTALKAVRNDFVASLDSDCIAHRDWLKVTMEQFKENEIVGVGGCLIEKYTTGIANQWRIAHMKQQWGNRVIKNPPFLYGNNAVYRLKPLKDVGFFNEEFRYNYEDLDISRKLLNKGYALIYIPRAIVYHLRNDSINSVLKTFWSWIFFDLPLPKDKINLIKKAVNNIKLGLSFSFKDCCKKDFELLFIDLILPLYHIVLDFKYYYNQKDE